MNKIYDNGYYLLGKVNDIINYINKMETTSDLEETMFELKKELVEYYDKESIVCINYDNGMGCTIEEFTENDILK